MRQIRPLSLPVLLLVCLALVAPATAHEGDEAYIDIATSELRQGQVFTVVAGDLDPNARATVAMTAGGQSYPLGKATTDSDGHFSAEFQVPAQIPDGYVELTAETEVGTHATIWVLVGEEEDLSGVRPGSDAPASDLLGSNVLVLLIGVVLLVVAGALLFLRLRHAQSQG